MGYPCLGAASLGRYRMAEYTPKNSFMLPHAIALNFMEMDTGIDVCEHIAHELVHMWEHSLGYDLSGNAHNEQFHNKMSDYGIATQGVMGRHVGYMGDVWQDWLKRNEDLKLETFKLGQT